MNRKEYVKINALSSSRLSAFARELQGLPAWTGDEKFNQFGIDFHKIVLEPEKELEYKWEGEDATNLIGMREACFGNSALMTIMDHPQTVRETWKVKTLDIDGVQVPFRGILDIHNPFFRISADLKSTSVTKLSKFVETMHKYHYWRQANIYKRLAGLEHFWFFGVRKKSPYKIFPVNTAHYPDEMEEGWQEVKRLTTMYLEKYPDFLVS